MSMEGPGLGKPRQKNVDGGAGLQPGPPRDAENDMLERRQLAALQGTYFLATGLWPLVHMKSFLRVTGPKRDLWLVRTVGALIAVSGAVMLRAARTDRVGEETALLATGSAVALGAVDVIYTAKGTISPIYLLDAAAEAVLVGAWTGSK